MIFFFNTAVAVAVIGVVIGVVIVAVALFVMIIRSYKHRKRYDHIHCTIVVVL